jgi:hypothetical protein
MDYTVQFITTNMTTSHSCIRKIKKKSEWYQNHYQLPNTTVIWSALLLHNWDVLDSSLGTETEISKDRGFFFWHFSVPPEECLASVPNLAMTTAFHILSNSLLIKPFINIQSELLTASFNKPRL